jgi:hypothetical protein
LVWELRDLKKAVESFNVKSNAARLSEIFAIAKFSRPCFPLRYEVKGKALPFLLVWELRDLKKAVESFNVKSNAARLSEIFAIAKFSRPGFQFLNK